MAGILGYDIYPAASGQTAHLWHKPATSITRIPGTPDAILGEFTDSTLSCQAVLELKTPGTQLDARKSGRNNLSPVEQAFGYGTTILGVRWVAVTDLRKIRLYSVESDEAYHEFDLALCAQDNEEGRDHFSQFWFLLHRNYLLSPDGDSEVFSLLQKSATQSIQIEKSFYQLYSEVRSDLHEALTAASQQLPGTHSGDDLLSATQRLLDRLLFIFYCQDHPQQLLQRSRFEEIVEQAARLPGPAQDKIYTNLKAFFREIDEGSVPGNEVSVPAYNGELFKAHPIIDRVSLPDSLGKKVYVLHDPPHNRRIDRGVWGLHVYDFWKELNEHLLGHIFETSLSEMRDPAPLSEDRRRIDELKQRKLGGIYYTDFLLSEHLSHSCIDSYLQEFAPLPAENAENLTDALDHRLRTIEAVRILDPSCGSGAFLVSSLAKLIREHAAVADQLDELSHDALGDASLLSFGQSREARAEILRNCVFGKDLLPQAAEISKLALWLRSARKGERVPSLGNNISFGDSLASIGTSNAPRLQAETYDIIIGNPPWGAEFDESAANHLLNQFDLDPRETWNTWELFLLLAIHCLKPNGRLGFVLPDSLLYTEKARIRCVLLRHLTPEKVVNLGPDWFGKDVRMSTILFQARKSLPSPLDSYAGTVVSGRLRREAIRGKIPLTQIEAVNSKEISLERALSDETCPLDTAVGLGDQQILDRIDSLSQPLTAICERARGEEMSKSGLLWRCPSCNSLQVPGVIKKGSYEQKDCSECGHTLTEQTVTTEHLVSDEPLAGMSFAPFIDGDDITSRYAKPRPRKFLRLNAPGWTYKDAAMYKGPKILIRQAGVGLFAALDESDARCAQSIYIYRLTEQAIIQGWRLEFLLGLLLSRPIAYVIAMRFAEVDPAKAHAKMTHDRLNQLPVPMRIPTNPNTVSELKANADSA